MYSIIIIILLIRTSPHLWGPFSAPTLVYRGSEPTSLFDPHGVIFYCPYIHPELNRRNGQIMYITYSGEKDGINRLVKITLSFPDY